MNGNCEIEISRRRGNAMSDGVHNTHCCKIHGCKYGNEYCPVEHGSLLGVECESCEADKHDPDKLRIKELESALAKCREETIEECAVIVAGAAPGFCGGKAETVLYTIAETLRSLPLESKEVEAEPYQLMEQRAEAAEAKCAEFAEWYEKSYGLKERAEAADAKLAECYKANNEVNNACMKEAVRADEAESALAKCREAFDEVERYVKVHYGDWLELRLKEIRALKEGSK